MMITNALALIGTVLALVVLLLMAISAVLSDLWEALGARGKRSP